MKEKGDNNKIKLNNNDVIPLEKRKTIRNRRYLYNHLLLSIIKCLLHVCLESIFI